MRPILYSYKKLSSEELLEVNNSGQYPKQAKVLKTLLDVYTGQLIETTDIKQNISKRNANLWKFYQTYDAYHQNQEISVLSLVLNYNNKISFSNKIASLKKKLNRKGITIHAYLWVRDLGDIDYQKHIHLIIVINRINGVIFKSLFEKKLDNNYKVEFCKSLKGTIKYITNKPLYGKANQATYHITKLQVPKAT